MANFCSAQVAGFYAAVDSCIRENRKLDDRIFRDSVGLEQRNE